MEGSDRGCVWRVLTEDVCGGFADSPCPGGAWPGGAWPGGAWLAAAFFITLTSSVNDPMKLSASETPALVLVSS